MKRIWPLAVLGIVAYLIFALATLPAPLLLSRLEPAVIATGVQGTVWKGSAQAVQVGTTNLGSLSWDLHVLPLFSARAVADVKLTRPDGFAQGKVTLTPGGRVSAEGLSASLPLSVLPPNVAPGGWTGAINARLSQLVLEDGWPTHAEGTIEIMDLTGPARRPVNLGSFKVTFPPGATDGQLVGGLADLGGPLELAGNIQLQPDRSYLIEGAVASRRDAPRFITDSLQFLPPPDADGRRPFSLSGTM